MLMAFLIGIGLSMDAFSVSITNGMNMKRVEFKEAVKIALFYGIFQFIMPVMGFFAAGIFKSYIEAVDHWVAFLLLAFIGTKMIIEHKGFNLAGNSNEHRRSGGRHKLCGA